MVYSHEAMRQDYLAIVEHAQHVRIDTERVRLVAERMRTLLAQEANHPAEPDPVPIAVLQENSIDTLQYYFVLTSQEFLIWRRNESGSAQAWDITLDGRSYVGAPGIVACHIRALQQGKPMLDPEYLASMTLQDVTEFYRDDRTGETTLQMLPQRLAKFNELGRVLLDSYSGHVANLLRQTEGYLFRDDGGGLVQQLCLNFPTAYFDWPFCKLAFLVAKFWHSRVNYNLPTTDEFRSLATVRDPQHSEIAADYYIPLFFIRTGIFHVSDEFGAHLSQQQLIERNGRMEREFRAATMVAGRMLAEHSGCSIDAVDYHCWQMGYLRCRLCRVDISDEELPCAYRDLSVAYQSEHALMQMRWPLVLTTCY